MLRQSLPHLGKCQIRLRLDPKTEIGIGWEAEKDLVGRAGRGYKGCIATHHL